MPDTKHKDDQLIILDVVDDPVVADANAKLTVATLQLDAPRRSWVVGERPYRYEQSAGCLPIEFPNGLRRRGSITDCIRHRTGSEAKLAREFLVGDSPFFATSVGSTADVSLILQGLQCTIKELGRHDHGPATCSARGDLDWLSLSCSDVVALLATELGQGHGSHEPMVQLVQVVLKWWGHPDVETERDYTLNLNSTTSPSCMT